MPIKILIADDFDAVRRSIRNILRPASDIELLGEASDYAEALRLIESHNPEVVVLDLHMPVPDRMTAADVGSAIAKSPCRVIAISVWVDGAAQELAQALGAVARLDKSELASTLIPAIRTAATSSTKVHLTGPGL